jgi:glycosyltransferase involved in cell wall biosynthesis
VRTIHLTAMRKLTPDPEAAAIARRVLDRVGMVQRRYLLYPAQAWPHKNHAALLRALAAYRDRAPATDLGLVCTGATGSQGQELRRLAAELLPPGWVAFTGFVEEREFAALLSRCRALIFPSLYEGFGMPVLEAMAYDRPVLCSNLTSLPEVAADAALLFDPRDSQSITGAIARLESEPALELLLVRRGRKRLGEFGTARDVAARYLDICEEVVRARAA